MKQLTGLLFILSLFVGCNQFSGTVKGTLDASEKLSLTSTNFFGKPKTVTIEPGAHTAAISFNLKSVSLKVDDESAVKFKIDDQTLPAQGGEFYLSASASGQPYDLAGNIDLDESYGPVQHANESCQKQETFQVCDHGKCHMVTHIVHGTQWVRYQMKTTTLLLSADLLKAERTHAEVKAGGKKHEKLYLYQGPCF